MNNFVKKHGVIDHFFKSGGDLEITGWAASENGEKPIKFIVLFDGKSSIAVNFEAVRRPDVSKHLNVKSDDCGFRILVSANLVLNADSVSIFAKFSSSEKDIICALSPTAQDDLNKLKNAFVASSIEKYSMIDLNLAQNSNTVNAVNYLSIYGEPNTGKTNLGRWFSQKSNRVAWVHTDSIFNERIASEIPNIMQFWENSIIPGGHLNIRKYVNSDSYDIYKFTSYLSEEISAVLMNKKDLQTVILEGYALKDYVDIFNLLRVPEDRFLALETKITSEGHYVNGFNVTKNSYSELSEYISRVFKEKCSAAILKKSTYQDLSSVINADQTNTGKNKTDSDTELKYIASHLTDRMSIKSKFLDIGCNAGFYCFKAAQLTDAAVVGIDMNKHWLEIGSQFNNSILNRGNITFLNVDAFDFLADKSSEFDVIHCSSTYHYFRERQTDFVRSARSALSLDGFLILEVELSDEITDQPYTVYRARGVDPSPCAFPNRMLFIEQVSEYFDVVAEYKSVFQKGSFYDRTYFHLRAK